VRLIRLRPERDPRAALGRRLGLRFALDNVFVNRPATPARVWY
jgi:hypothetical protein